MRVEWKDVRLAILTAKIKGSLLARIVSKQHSNRAAGEAYLQSTFNLALNQDGALD
jgi:hypothetical protein